MMKELDVDSAAAGEIMTPNVIMLPETTPLKGAIDVLHTNRISAVFIQSDKKRAFFILSHDDILAFLSKNGNHSQDTSGLFETPVSQIMTGPIKPIDVGRPVDKIIHFMTQNDYKRVLVTRASQPVGVISTRDILIWNNSYFRPAKPQVLLFMDNQTSNFIATHIFEKNVDLSLKRNLIDLYGGALSAISFMTEEIMSQSGKMCHLKKDNRSVLFEPYYNITGILICDYNSIDLRRKLLSATRKFYHEYILSDGECVKEKDNIKMYKIPKLALIFSENT